MELSRQGKSMNHKKVERIMRKYGLRAICPKEKYSSYKGDNGYEKKNLLLKEIIKDGKKIIVRDFKASRPNEKWTTDVSEFKTRFGKLYLSPILDMYDGLIISYNISATPNFELVTKMAKKAFAQYQDLEGLIFQSDQGWPYQMEAWRNELLDRKIKQSFSRKGNCMDNSLIENFFGIMKKEMFYNREFDSLDELKREMIKYIKYYNTKRINKKRGGLTIIEYRNKFYSQDNKMVH